MTTLDLNACGVQEMNKQEMIEVNGGKFFKALRTALNVVATAAVVLGIVMML
jgi:hypothetical protein